MRLFRGFQAPVPLLLAADRKLPATHQRTIVRPARPSSRSSSGGIPGADIHDRRRRVVRHHPCPRRCGAGNPVRAFSLIRHFDELRDGAAAGQGILCAGESTGSLSSGGAQSQPSFEWSSRTTSVSKRGWMTDFRIEDTRQLNQTPAGPRGPGGRGVVYTLVYYAARRTSSTVMPGSHAMHSFLNWHQEHCIPGWGW